MGDVLPNSDLNRSEDLRRITGRGDHCMDIFDLLCFLAAAGSCGVCSSTGVGVSLAKKIPRKTDGMMGHENLRSVAESGIL